MHYPPNEMYTALSFVGFLMCAIPFYWHMEAWNAGTCLYMAWTGLGCLMQCINSIIWNKNMVDRAKIYCFISVRIQCALNVAIPASSLCIARRLYCVAAMKPMMSTRAEKRRELTIDLLIGLGIPILEMIIGKCTLISDHAYGILEDIGPFVSIPVTLISLVLFASWPVMIGAVSFMYSSESFYKLYKRERQLKELISCNPSLNRSRYLRLMALSTVEMLGTIPMGLLVMVTDVKIGHETWITWAELHGHYFSIPQYPFSEWSVFPNAFLLELYRWSLVLCAFIFFSFFGFADEARQHYRLAYTWLATKVKARLGRGDNVSSERART
ncbi:GPCR fungal pheromone mating factor [Russula compacta]|nr:GPCR fungal pheromone mating factor [Russula compacta]